MLSFPGSIFFEVCRRQQRARGPGPALGPGPNMGPYGTTPNLEVVGACHITHYLLNTCSHESGPNCPGGVLGFSRSPPLGVANLEMLHAPTHGGGFAWPDGFVRGRRIIMECSVGMVYHVVRACSACSITACRVGMMCIAMAVPWPCHAFAIAMHSHSMAATWHCQGCDVPLPWHWHGTAMALPGHFDSTSMALRWHFHGSC